MSDTEDENLGTAATQARATGHGVTEIAAVALKLPPLWSADPQVWFARIESQFFTRKIHPQNSPAKFTRSFSLPNRMIMPTTNCKTRR